MESTFTDGNTFPISGKSFAIRYFSDTKETYLVRNKAVTITQTEINEAIQFENAITTDGAINYGQVFPATNQFLPIAAPEQFVSNFANSPNLQRTVIDAAKTVSGQTTPAGTTSPAPNPDEQGGSTPVTTPSGPTEPENTVLFYPNDLGTTFNSDNQDVIAFEAFDYKSGIGNRLSPGESGSFGELKPVQFEKTKEPIIVLPIQSSITDQNSVGWESDTMNPIEIEAADLSYDLMTSNTTLELIQAATGFYNNALKSAKSSGNEIRTYLVGQAVGVNNLLSRLEGKVLNPNLELLFQSPQLRPFNFTFKMSPRNSEEAQTVKKIINFFKKNMAARKDNVVFLKAPRVFKIKYLYGATFQEHPGMNLIKMCALTNCSVDYTPLGSYATFKDGTMVAYSITLSFQELTPIYDTDYTTFDYGDGDKVSNHPIGA